MTQVPSNYVEISIEGSEDAPHVMNYLFSVLHGIQRKKKLPLVLDFPEYTEGQFKRLGTKVRVWGEVPALNACIAALAENSKISSYVKVGLVQSFVGVPALFVAFVRVRLHSKKHREHCFKREVREVRNYPFAEIKTSGGQAYALRIRRVMADAPSEGKEISSYGVSSAENLVFVPYVPE